MTISLLLRRGSLGLLMLLTQGGFASDQYDPNDSKPQPAAKAGVLIPLPAPVNNLLNNGGFETNSGVGTPVSNGWTMVTNTSAQQASGWFVQSGVTSPINNAQVEMPTEGDFSAMTESGGSSVSILYQDIQLPAGSLQLSCDIYLNNQASDYYNNGTLNFDPNIGPNQYFRMDIMNPSAVLDDVGGGVLQNLYITNPGDALVQSYQTVTANLSAFSGQTVRLRFAEVDNQFFFNVGVDNCILQVTSPTAPIQSVPVGGRWSSLILTLMLSLFAGMLLTRKNRYF